MLYEVITPGGPINFAQVNNENLAPGAVIQNNIIVASETGGGIHFSGEASAAPNAAIRNNFV